METMKVYADNAATTKPSSAAIQAMLPYLEEFYGNPSSLYTIGQKAMDTLFAEHYSQRNLTLIVIFILLIILPLSVGSLASNNFNPFIYFRF